MRSFNAKLQRQVIQQCFYAEFQRATSKISLDFLRMNTQLHKKDRSIRPVRAQCKARISTASLTCTEAQIFSALSSCPLESVRCVILGQDPYHKPNQAMGLSFSVVVVFIAARADTARCLVGLLSLHRCTPFTKRWLQIALVRLRLCLFD